MDPRTWPWRNPLYLLALVCSTTVALAYGWIAFILTLIAIVCANLEGQGSCWKTKCICPIDWDDRCPVHGDDDDAGCENCYQGWIARDQGNVRCPHCNTVGS